MHDIRQIRDNPEAFDAALARRGLAARANEILAVDENWRELTQALQTSLAARNEASKAIGVAKSRKDEDEANRLMAEVSEHKAKIPALEAEERSTLSKLNDLLASIPNLADESVPMGADENENVVMHVRGEVVQPEFPPLEHHEIGPALGLDFETAQKVAGARFAYLRGGIARLSRALGQFMLDLHTGEFGYQEVSPPVLVRDEALYGTGQLPKFAEDQFRTTDGRWLIPTAEVSLTNMVREMILEEHELPIRLTALTPCFRSEAGAAGRDTRGMIRQHQFEKVELVSIVRPEDSDAEHERMTSCAEAVLESLGLPFRRMLLCTGDMGFSAQKTFDLEVWLPGQQRYREISSCSNCGDFQARRMNARFRREGEKGTVFVHTLNGSGLAVGRALVAVIENYQNADGSVSVPAVLQPYMGGMERITAA
ncbi:MAG: serine--tRNA ligase [Sphingomonadaceae bacterium]